MKNLLDCVSKTLLAGALLGAASFGAMAQTPNSAVNAAEMAASAAARAHAVAASAASAAAAKHAEAEKHAALHRTGKAPSSLTFGTLFHPNVVVPYADGLARLLAELKAVTNAQQAAAFGERFKAEYPAALERHKRFSFALLHYGHAANTNQKTPEIAQAESQLPRIDSTLQAIAGEFTRVAKISPALTPLFQQWEKDFDD